MSADGRGWTARLYGDDLAEALDEFVERVWPRDGSRRPGGESARRGPRLPDDDAGSAAPRILVLRGQQIVGHIEASPIRVWSGSGVAPAHWVVGFMVLPEYRQGLVGPLVIKKANETLSLAMTLHVEEAALRVFKGSGWKHLGLIPQYARVLNGVRLLSSLPLDRVPFLFRWCGRWRGSIAQMLGARVTRFTLGLALSTTCRLWALTSFFTRRVSGGCSITEERGFDGSYDLLWEKVGRQFGALVVRDLKYLTRRFGERMELYRLLACRRASELLGYCIFKIKQYDGDARMGDTRIGTVVDCLFNPEDGGEDLQALIAAAIRLCRQERVDAMLCTASHPVVHRVLRQNGFVRVPGSLNFAYWDTRGVLGAVNNTASWHIMRGDSDGDQNL